MIYFR